MSWLGSTKSRQRKESRTLGDFKVTLAGGVVEFTDDDQFEDAHEVRTFLVNKVARHPSWVTIGHLTFHSQALVCISEHDREDDPA